MLRLGGHKWSDVYPLARLDGLRELGLAGNTVEDLRALSDLAGLRRLDLRGNAVEDVRPLRAMPSLIWMHPGREPDRGSGPAGRSPGAHGGGPATTESRRALQANATESLADGDHCWANSGHVPAAKDEGRRDGVAKCRNAVLLGS